MVSINRRWTPAEMQDLKMSWTATRITIFGRRDVSHGHASERHRAAPRSWNAPDTQGPPEEDGAVTMVNALIFNVPVDDENCRTFMENLLNLKDVARAIEEGPRMSGGLRSSVVNNTMQHFGTLCGKVST